MSDPIFDDVTPRLGLPYVVAAQAQKHIPINESLARLDGLVQLAVESRGVAAQPATPVAGGVWILPASATGAAWAGQSVGTLMRFESGAWEPLAPAEGVLAWVKDENQMVVFDGAAWTPLSATFRNLTAAASPNLATTRLEILEQEVTLSTVGRGGPWGGWRRRRVLLLLLCGPNSPCAGPRLGTLAVLTGRP